MHRSRRRQLVSPRTIARVIPRRTFFGMGEILGVLANPAETVRQIAESRKMLEEARQDMQQTKERLQIPEKHTFSPLPGFFARRHEIKAIERALSGLPAFSVLFGASSVGKTALLRQVLSQDRYHVLFFDLRISGFADLQSLYFSLVMQMEQFFVSLKDRLEGYDQFEKESWAFKHDRLAIEKRIENGGTVKTADVAHLMELFQSALLKYWNFQPDLGVVEEEEEQLDKKPSTDDRRIKSDAASETESSKNAVKKPKEPPVKKIPVFFLDEAHKLPSLIKTDEAMKSLLDAMLVLTKQDRLIHVIHATSDGFYMHWLRQMNVLQHCLLLTVGDASYAELKEYYLAHLLPEIPPHLQNRLNFDELYEVFGGKMAHWSSYLDDFVNSDGNLPIKESSHYLQAYALLQLQLVHAMSPPSQEQEGDGASTTRGGFQIYSSVPTSASTNNPFEESSENPGFSADTMLHVMESLRQAKPTPWELLYFPLCRQLGANTVDAMVRGRILELRWTPTITPEAVVLPTTPVIRYAMQAILEEYESISDTNA